MARKPALLDEVLTLSQNRKPGFGTWYSRLPEDARKELDAVRSAFDPQRHQKRAYARAIIEACQARGWETSGIQGVIAWLDGKR